MRVKARPGQMDVSRDNLHRKNGAHIWLQQCEWMWICLSECMKNSKRFLHFDSFFCRLDQISSLQIGLTQPKRWSIFSKRSNELVICAKILVSEVSGNSLWSHLSLQLHISLHLPVYLTAHPPKAGDAYQNLVIKFDEPGTKRLHKMIFFSHFPAWISGDFQSSCHWRSSLKPDGHHEFSWIPYHDVVMRYGIVVCLPFPSNVILKC